MICKFGIEVCYAPLGEFQIRGSEDLLGTLLKRQRLSSTHTIWTIKFEICGSKHHTLSEFLPGEGPQQLCIIDCLAFLPEEDLLPSLSFPRITKMFVLLGTLNRLFVVEVVSNRFTVLRSSFAFKHCKSNYL